MKYHLFYFFATTILAVSCISTSPIVSQATPQDQIMYGSYDDVGFYRLNNLTDTDLPCLQNNEKNQTIVASLKKLMESVDRPQAEQVKNVRQITVVGDIIKGFPERLIEGNFYLRFALCPNMHGDVIVAKLLETDQPITQIEEQKMMPILFNYKYQVNSSQVCLECESFEIKIQMKGF